MSTTALIVVDIQNDYFPGGKWPLDGVEAAADNAARIIAAARKKGDLVIHVRHETPSPDAPFFVPGSAGAQLHAKAAALPGEKVILKHFMSPYRETELLDILRSSKIEAVTVVGNMSHMCIDAVTRASDDFGFKTTVIHDACATHDLAFNGVTVPSTQVHAAFMAALRFGYATVVSADEFLA
ncbi:cysteine hydrolase family protein [Pseudomonas sp. NPDC089569]|uniref:cysteine hydrolase family protein n=1 Tax=Pseudomonas sp. NPDC089569 TaxID=3390722 RepID=UPI003D00AF1E